MTIAAIKAYHKSELAKKFSENEVAHILAALLEKHTDLDKTNQIINEEQTLSSEIVEAFETEIKRIIDGEPFQYVLGYTWFYDLKINVNNHVLIPRPETEELVDWIVNDYTKNESIDILDIGTGSGCIALGIKSALKNAKVTGVDISEDALSVAKKNAAENNLEVHFEAFDVLNYLPNKQNALYDIIVSNPPYISIDEKDQMAYWVVKYEPAIALFTKADSPLIFYEAILGFSRQYLKKDGYLYFEIHEEKAQDIIALIEKFGFTNAVIKQDLQGKDRMIKANWKG